jgi:uncharacterized protein (TIGR00730 family)
MSESEKKRAPLAYENEAFLNSPDGRILRILSEYMEPLARFRREQIQDTVVFFGSARFSSRAGAQDKLGELESSALQFSGSQLETCRKRAIAAVDMARYYEDARQLAFLLSKWSIQIPARRRRFVVTTGGGPGIMEAANLGAQEAGAKTVGLNIALPFEQMPNPYITPSLNFEFHYFFMRKFWFAYLAKALVIFPGGFGTMDEMFEVMTLAQTRKLESKIVIVLYGKKFWQEVLNFEALVEHGTIDREDLNLFQYADDPETALGILQEQLTRFFLEPEKPLPEAASETPEIAKSRV